MAGKRVSELPSASGLNLGDFLPVLNNGVLRRSTIQTLLQRALGTLAPGVYRAAKITVGSEGTVTSIENGLLRASAVLDFPNLTAGSESQLTATVTGASVGDPVCVSPPVAFATGLAVTAAWVSTANTVTIRVRNTTAGAIDPASGEFAMVVFKS